jgi:hypothetical protein
MIERGDPGQPRIEWVDEGTCTRLARLLQTEVAQRAPRQPRQLTGHDFVGPSDSDEPELIDGACARTRHGAEPAMRSAGALRENNHQ